MKVFSYFFLLSLVLVFSCKKEENSFFISPKLVGDYDWVYSAVSDTENITNTEIEDAYGIRITKKNRVLFYKNGKKIKKDIITSSYYSGENENWSIIFLNIPKSGYYKNGILYIKSFPLDFNEYTINYFLKK